MDSAKPVKKLIAPLYDFASRNATEERRIHLQTSRASRRALE
jgi:hypothetical protein